jgi:predicted permease
MNWWTTWADSVRAVFRRRALDADIEDELSFHLEMHAAHNERAGMTRAAARRAARLRFGSTDRFAEECRDMRGVQWLDEMRQDARVAFRSLRGAPYFTVVVLLTLSLGIGATTAVFSVVYGILLRPLPYAVADRVLMVWENDRASGTVREAASVPDYFDFSERNRTFERLAGFTTVPLNLVGADGEPVRVSATLVTHTLPHVLAIKTAMGRFPTQQEDAPGAARVAVLSDRLWRTRFAAAPAVLNQTVRIDGQAYQIIGVLPPAIEFPDASNDIWLPLQHDATTTPRSRHQLSVVGRLKPGVSVEQAQADMTRIATALEEEYPRDNNDRGTFVEPIGDVILGPVRRALTVLFAAVGAVLLIGCANLANLMLARAASRRGEVTVRSVLGATRGRLTRQFLVETIILVGTGLALSLFVARNLLSALVAMAPSSLPRLSSVQLDGAALAFAGLAAVLITAVFSALPALDAQRVRLQESLTSAGTRVIGGRLQLRLRSTLVVAQIALSVLLVTTAGLLIRSFWLIQQVDPGFVTDQVLRASFRLPAARYPQSYEVYPNWPEVQNFFTEVQQRVRAMPGVRAVGLASNHPLSRGFTNGFVIVGREAESVNQAEISTRMVSAGYFAAVGLPLRQGRLLQESDRAGTPPVLVINEAAVRRYFPDVNPIGNRIRFWGAAREIVGVVGDEHMYGVTEAVPPAVYSPLAQTPIATTDILLRSEGDPAEQIRALRAAVAGIDRELALFQIESMRTTLDDTIAPQRFTAALLGLFAGTALLLALVGIHGLISYAVSQRGREAGIRAALGATPREIVGLMVREGGRLALIGAGLGVLVALFVGRTLQTLLYEIQPTDSLTFVAVTGIIVLTTGTAIYLPARRLARINPASALRSE